MEEGHRIQPGQRHHHHDRCSVVLLSYALVLGFLCLLGGLPPSEAVFDDMGQLPADDHYIHGDIMLGALVRLYFPERERLCGKANLSRPGVQVAAAINYTLGLINASPRVLAGLKLGVAILNDCDRPSVALARASKFIPLKQCFHNRCDATAAATTTTGGGGVAESYRVVGVMGPYSSSMSVPVATMLGLYRIPVMSWSATSPELSNSDKFKYFARATPSDEHLVEAIVSMLVRFNWTYVSTLNVLGSYGAQSASAFRRRTKRKGICIAYEAEVSHDDTAADYDDIVRDLLQRKGAYVVVVFLDGGTTEALLKAVHRNNASWAFLFIGNDGFQPNLADLPSVVPVRSITFNVRSPDPDFEAFYRNLSPFRLGPNGNPWLGEYTEKELNCTWNGASTRSGRSCEAFHTLADVDKFHLFNGIGRISTILWTYAYALDKLIKDNCPGVRGERLYECIKGEVLFSYMTNTSFVKDHSDELVEYDENGDVYGNYFVTFIWGDDNQEYMARLKKANSTGIRLANGQRSKYHEVDIGSWDRRTKNLTFHHELLPWSLVSTAAAAATATELLSEPPSVTDTVQPLPAPQPDEKGAPVLPKSICSEPCEPGHYELKGELECCWECKRCRDHEKVNSNNSGCDACPEKTWPEQQYFNSCVPIEPHYMPHSAPAIAFTLVTLAAFGLISVAIILGLFIRHWERKVIKGCTRELMVPILVGLAMAYLTVFAFIVPPTSFFCFLNYVGFNLSCCLLFGPLFLKTKRLHMIFQASDKCKKRVRLADSKSLVVALVIILIVQVLLLVLAMCLAASKGLPIQAIDVMPLQQEQAVERRCHMELYVLLIPLCYNLLLLVLCAVYGFLTRKLPENYNESWYIFIAVTTTLFVWLACVPTYFVAFYAKFQVSLLSLALIVNGLVISVCLFVPKIYAVYNIPDRDIRVSRLGSRRLSIGVGVPDNNSPAKLEQCRSIKK